VGGTTRVVEKMIWVERKWLRVELTRQLSLTWSEGEQVY